MNINECVVCKRNADIVIPLIKTMEVPSGYDNKLTLTGTKSVITYVYPAVYKEKAGVCRSCIQKAKKQDVKSIIVVFIIMIIFLGTIISIITLAIISSLLKETFTFSQSITASLITGPFLAAFGTSIAYMVTTRNDRKKSKEELEILLGAGVIRRYLNKNRRPNDYRYFTVEEWEKMQVTGKHPDSF